MTPFSLEALVEEAIRLAERALEDGEVPVGAVVSDLEGRILGKGKNSCIKMEDPTAHGEVLAIRDAAKRMGNYRLTNTVLICTLEPCPMCYGAILNARIPILVYCLEDREGGALSLGLDLVPKGCRRPYIVKGIKKERCLNLIKRFFEYKR